MFWIKFDCGGAPVYAFHCGESGLLFLGVWHSLDVSLGKMLERTLMRW